MATIEMRITTELLIKQAEIYGIKIIQKILPEGLLGEADADTLTISLDKGMDNCQTRDVLAEEIGHMVLPPRPGHIRYHSRSFHKNKNCSMIKHIVAQDERLARDWATRLLLGNVDLEEIKNVSANNIAELANHFEVDPWFIEHRIGYLRRKKRESGNKAKWKELIKRT